MSKSHSLILQMQLAVVTTLQVPCFIHFSNSCFMCTSLKALNLIFTCLRFQQLRFHTETAAMASSTK